MKSEMKIAARRHDSAAPPSAEVGEARNAWKHRPWTTRVG
jgi:hypothetical protein